MSEIVQQNQENLIRYMDGLFKVNQFINPSIIMNNLDKSLPTLKTYPPTDMYIPIEYDNLSIPYVDGVLLWEKLPWEDEEQYSLFREYREQITFRSTFEIAKRHNKSTMEVNRLAKLLQWALRAESFDTYQDLMHKNVTKVRRREISESHFLVAQELFDKCATYCEQNISEFKPKEIIDLMKLVSEMGKSAVGLYETTVKGGEIPSTIVNVNQTNTSNSNNGNQVVVQETIISDDIETEKNRLAGILNIMNQIGAFNQQNATTEELDMENVIISYDGNVVVVDGEAQGGGLNGQS